MDGTIAAGVSAVGNAAVAAASNKRQYKNQMKAMQQQQAYNKELWDYQNAYNTPQQQMQRLEAAGLNPHLIYGSGSAATGNAGSIAPTEVPVKQPIRPDLGTINDAFMQRLVVRQMDAQYNATVQATANARTKNAIDSSNAALKNLDLMKEQYRSKNYRTLVDAEKFTKQFVAANAEQLFYSTQKDVQLKDQLHGFRKQNNPQLLTAQGQENAFRENRNKLAELGIYQSDHAALRILITSANRMGIDLGELLTSNIKELKELIGRFK